MSEKTKCATCGREWTPAPPGYVHKCQCGHIMTRPANKMEK